jgi:hypothetical protein
MPTSRDEPRASTTPLGKTGTFHPTILPATNDRLMPAATPMKPPARLKIEDSIERALVLAREGIGTKTEIQLRAPSQRISPRWTDQVPLEIGWQVNLSELEKSLIERALRQAQGNKSRAAELLGIHRRLLYEKMGQFGVE